MRGARPEIRITRRSSALAALFFSVLVPLEALAQGPAPAPPEAVVAVAEQGEKAHLWSFNASAAGYFVPDEDYFTQAVATLDFKALHLEARYNYEAIGATSFWGGWNFHTGSSVTFDATPILGVVVGDLHGVAPGLELAVGWKWIELSAEAEYVFDTDDSSGNYFYTWNQLTFTPAHWLQLGLVAQRTRIRETNLTVQRGPFVGVAIGKFVVTGYYFNPGDGEDEFTVVSLSFGF